MEALDRESHLKHIGERLKDFRKSCGYKSQESFASDLGITRGAYKNYELGKSEPTPAVLHNLSTKFGADINYILTGKSEQEMPDFDTYLTRMGVDDTMKAIVTGYMALPPDKRKTVKEYIESLAAEIAEGKAAAKEKPPVSDSDTPPVDGVPPAPEYYTPPGYDLVPEIEDKVKKIRAKFYAQAYTSQPPMTSPSTEPSSANEKSRPSRAAEKG